MKREESVRKKCASCGKELRNDEAVPFDQVFLCLECFEIVEASRDTH